MKLYTVNRAGHPFVKKEGQFEVSLQFIGRK